MNCPRVLALVGYQDVSAWWRVIRPFSELQRRGCPVEWAIHGDPAAMERAADYRWSARYEGDAGYRQALIGLAKEWVGVAARVRKEGRQ